MIGLAHPSARPLLSPTPKCAVHAHAQIATVCAHSPPHMNRCQRMELECVPQSRGRGRPRVVKPGKVSIYVRWSDRAGMGKISEASYLH